MADVWHLAAVPQLSEIFTSRHPPVGEGLEVQRKSPLKLMISIKGPLNGTFGVNRWTKNEVAGTFRLKQTVRSDAEFSEIVRTRPNLLFWDSTYKVSSYVFRLRVGRVIHVAPDIEVAVVFVDDCVFVD